jgi:hypothetical protein
MFGFGKKAMFARMNEYVDIVQVALSYAALQEQRRLGVTENRRVAAALANLLTGRDGGSAHANEDRRLARVQATTLLENQKIRFAAVMCLRTTAITGGADVAKIAEVVRWVGSIGEIPPFPPDPDVMRELQYHMAMEFCPPDAGTFG